MSLKKRILFRKNRLSKTVFLSGISVWLENLARTFWPLLCWVLFFSGLFLFGVHEWLSNTLHSLLFLTFFAGFIGFIWWKRTAFKWPDEDIIYRRLELDNTLINRPLDQIGDKAVNANFNAALLWERAKERNLQALKAIKVSSIQPKLAFQDPYAIRFFMVLFVLAGFIFAGPLWSFRLFTGMNPFFPELNTQVSELDTARFWITPPDYTRIQQIVLKTEDTPNKRVIYQVPQGSALKASTKGFWGAPSFTLSHPKSQQQNDTEFTRADDENYTAETILNLFDDINEETPDPAEPEPLLEDGTLPQPTPQTNHDEALESLPKEKDGFPKTYYKLSYQTLFWTRKEWYLDIIPDEKPSIKSIEEPVYNDKQGLEFVLEAYDDYGIKSVTMDLTLDPVVDTPPLGEPYSETRALRTAPKEPEDIKPLYDLTSHTWAGLPVVITFTAEDDLGQTGVTEEIKLTLPEREFKHPIAKAIVALRKDLAWSPYAGHEEIAAKLEVILSEPDLFHGDWRILLGLRTAASRLRHTLDYAEEKLATAEALLPLLWNIALQIEDGDLTLAMRDLRYAQRELENALNNPNSTDEEITDLVDQLKQAMAEYLQELQKEIQKRIANGEQLLLIPPEALAQLMNPEGLSEFLSQLEDNILSGDRSSARDQLSQLQELMDLIDPSQIGEVPGDVQQMVKGINELQELIDKQKDLLGKTENIYSEEQEARKKGQPYTPDTQGENVEQDALRYVLGQLMLETDQKIGEIPPSMGKAELEMRGSAADLLENLPGTSIPHQKKAIEYLEESQDQLSQSLAQRLQQLYSMDLSQLGQGRPGGPARYDPLGRPYGGEQDGDSPFSYDDIQIPDEAERRRIEEIQRLLRDRSGDLNRSRQEREYFRRLLRQF